mgnify:FL=1
METSLDAVARVAHNKNFLRPGCHERLQKAHVHHIETVWTVIPGEEAEPPRFSSTVTRIFLLISVSPAMAGFPQLKARYRSFHAFVQQGPVKEVQLMKHAMTTLLLLGGVLACKLHQYPG